MSSEPLYHAILFDINGVIIDTREPSMALKNLHIPNFRRVRLEADTDQGQIRFKEESGIYGYYQANAFKFGPIGG